MESVQLWVGKRFCTQTITRMDPFKYINLKTEKEYIRQCIEKQHCMFYVVHVLHVKNDIA